jgi:AcrR family transcriptional regulator
MAKVTAKASKPSSEPRRALRRDDREKEILIAAAKVLDRDPRARIEDIAAAAGVSRQLVALYFPGGGIKSVVERLVETTIPVVASAIGAMEGILDLDDEAEFRVAVTRGMERYLKHSIERTPAFLLGNSREIGGASLEDQIEATYDAAFEIAFAEDSRWGASKTAKILFRIQVHTGEQIGYYYRIGRLSREECLQALIEAWVAFRFSILPSLL